VGALRAQRGQLAVKQDVLQNDFDAGKLRPKFGDGGGHDADG
jgi:hypothetical protein